MEFALALYHDAFPNPMREEVEFFAASKPVEPRSSGGMYNDVEFSLALYHDTFSFCNPIREALESFKASNIVRKCPYIGVINRKTVHNRKVIGLFD